MLGVREPQDGDWLAAIVRALRPRRAVLLLDNCEHLIEACAELAERLLRGCPYLHLLATSLEPLAAAGRSTDRVPPLAIPAGASDVQELSASGAVQLFVARVRAQLPDFTLESETPRWWRRSVGGWMGCRWRWSWWRRGWKPSASPRSPIA